MERRSFLTLLAAMATPPLSAASTSSSMKIRYYTVESYLLKNGTQLGRIHEYFGKHRIPALQRNHGGPLMVLEAIIAPHLPQVSFITGFNSLEDMSSVTAKVAADKEMMKRYSEWEEGSEPPFESQSVVLLEATPYSPELLPDKESRKSQRIFELRQYHSPTVSQSKALHQRFAGAEIKIFNRVGIHPVLYTSTMIGPNMPDLTYLTPFDNLEAREKAWAAFQADAEWIKVRRESIEQHGQISSVMQVSLWKAAQYSPVG
jgi:hypothetical protein